MNKIVKRRKKFFCCCCFTAIIYLYFTIPFIYNSNPSFVNIAKQDNTSYQRRNFLILLYTKFYREKWPIYSTECGFETSNFQITDSKVQFSRSDVVIFHSRNMPSIRMLKNLNKIRRKEQVWIYFTMEPIPLNPSVHKIDKYFNATASYGTDTDIPLPYRYHEKRLKIDKNVNVDYFSGKTKMVAWIVSNCRGNARNKLALKLISYGVDIHVSGACSSIFPNRFYSKCENHRPCYKDLHNFKFYFSAENNLCDGYISEKYWYTGLDYNVVPIVLGGSNYSDPRLAVPGSFIDAMSFDSPKALAKYILDVGSNSTKYNSFFDWKKKWRLDTSSKFCTLCDKISNGINFRKNPLKKTMHKDKCIRPIQKFNYWINKS